jgi:SAM-dependent methyltransferase
MPTSGGGDRESRGGAERPAVSDAARWDEKWRQRRGRPIGEPSPLLLVAAAASRATAPGGRALDVACGSGRHALALAAAGFQVTAVDASAEALAQLRAAARALGLAVVTRRLDLTRDELPGEAQDLVVCTLYLDRALAPALVRLVAPGGRLVLETFRAEQVARSGGRFLAERCLRPGELRELVGDLAIETLEERDDDEGRPLAGVVAVRTC